LVVGLDSFLETDVEPETLLEFSVDLVEFRELVADIIDQQGDDSAATRNVVDRLRNGDVVVSQTDDDVFASVIWKGQEVEALAVNPDAFEDKSRQKYEHTAAHEASHIFQGPSSAQASHDKRFYRFLIMTLENFFGGVGPYQEHLEKDIMINGRRDVDPASFPAISDRIYLSEVQINDALGTLLELTSRKEKLADFVERFEFNNEGTTLFEKIQDDQMFGGRGSFQGPFIDDETIRYKLKASRGRGRPRLEMVEIDAKSEDWRVLPEAEDEWFGLDFDEIILDKTQGPYQLEILGLQEMDIPESGQGLDSLDDVIMDAADSYDRLVDAMNDFVTNDVSSTEFANMDAEL
jgi:hypothetical protein